MKKEIPKVTLKKVLEKIITIPVYQRVYEWKKSNVIILFDDILKNYYSDQQRDTNLGTLILLSSKDNCSFELVDGQQRLVTLSLLIFVICDFLGEEYNNHILDDDRYISPKSNNCIVENYQVIRELVNARFKDNTSKVKFKNYLLNHINFYYIETANENIAFQLFDGRNSKNKELKPVDLLKAYHIGEMNNISKSEKAKILYNWSKNMKDSFSIDKSVCKNEYLFNNVFFNIYNWSLFKDRKEFENDDIYLYKGYKKTDNYKYVDFYKGLDKNHYLMNKPFEAGVYFFNMVEHYVDFFDSIIDDKKSDDNLYKRINNIYDISDYEKDFNYYMKNSYLLYYNALLFFYDKFGKDVDEFYLDIIKEKIFKWSMIYRVTKSFAGIPSTNAYVLNSENNFFYKCANAVQVKELLIFECDFMNNYKGPNNKGRCGKLRSIIWNIYHSKK